METIMNTNAPLTDADNALIEEFKALSAHLEEFRVKHPEMIVFAVFGSAGKGEQKKDRFGSFVTGGDTEISYAIARLCQKVGMLDCLTSACMFHLVR